MMDNIKNDMNDGFKWTDLLVMEYGRNRVHERDLPWHKMTSMGEFKAMVKKREKEQLRFSVIVKSRLECITTLGIDPYSKRFENKK